MQIDYTEHALFRMRHRRISKVSIEDTIRNPAYTFSTRLNRVVSSKRHGDKFLKVIYEKSNNKIAVVTVYWTRRS